MDFGDCGIRWHRARGRDPCPRARWLIPPAVHAHSSSSSFLPPCAAVLRLSALETRPEEGAIRGPRPWPVRRGRHDQCWVQRTAGVPTSRTRALVPHLPYRSARSTGTSDACMPRYLLMLPLTRTPRLESPSRLPFPRAVQRAAGTMHSHGTGCGKRQARLCSTRPASSSSSTGTVPVCLWCT